MAFFVFSLLFVSNELKKELSQGFKKYFKYI